MSSPLRVLVTGAAGQIGYAIVLQIAKGDVFGKDQPIVLVLLDIPPLATALEGVKFELIDCALPTLHGKPFLYIPWIFVVTHSRSFRC